MKQKLYLLLAGLLLLTLQLKAQAPDAFDYQAVARDASGTVMPNTSIGLRFTIRKTSPVGTIVYQEEQSATTNDFGLFSVPIGSGVVINGKMSNISWGSDSYYLQVEMDPTGGTVYINMGVTQLLSVPYALYARSGGTHYIGGTGIGITDSVISANAADAIWNANELQGSDISNTSPTSGQILQWNGTAWTPSTFNSGWNLTGNSGTTAGTDFVGTSDANDLVLKANNKEGLRVNHTSGNVGIGTTTPAQTLDVEGGNLQFGKALMPGGNAGTSGDILQSNGPNAAPTWVSGGGGGWSVNGTSGTSYPGNFIGTTDDNAIQFEVNGQEAGLVEDYDGGSGGNGNTGLGYQVLYNNYNSGGYQNTAMGFNAMYNAQYTYNNVGVGYQALYSDYSTTDNTAVGFQALYQNDQYYDEEAYYNTAVGSGALFGNIDGLQSTAVGYQALYNNGNDGNYGSGWYNVAIGSQAMQATTDGQWNACLGTVALLYNTTGTQNTAMGSPAMYNNQTGNYNVALGTNALNTNVTGNYNMALGYVADVSVDGLSNATAIGAYAQAINSNSIVLGSNGNNGAAVTEIDMNGSLSPWNGSSYDPGTPGYVLQSNGAGTNPTWVPAGGGGSGWGLSGNSGTVFGTNYIGTTDDQGLQFEVDGSESGEIQDNSSGSANTALGYQALIANSGIQNTAVGFQSLQANTSSYNTAVGINAAQQATSGSVNVAIGWEAFGDYSDGGSDNVAVGGGALAGPGGATGDGVSNNTAVGYFALVSNTSANNTAVGYGAASSGLSSGPAIPLTGTPITAIGYETLFNNTSGSDNVALGYQSLLNNTSSSNNTAIGDFTLQTNQTGNNLTAVGFDADVAADGLTNSIALGSGATITMSNQLIIPATVTHVNMAGIPAFADDATAGTGGLVKGDMYQTDGTGAAPLNVAGILMIKQ